MEAILNSPLEQRILGFSPMSIGRAPTNHIVLAHDNQVSGKHAEVNPTGQGYKLTELGSTNDTFVNGQRLAPYVPYVLKLQDTIRIGQTPFTFEMSSTSKSLPAPQSNPVPFQSWQPEQQSISPQPWTQYPQQNWSPQSVAPPPPPPHYHQYYLQAPMQPIIFQQSSFQTVTVNVKHSQYGCLVRTIYFLCIGWWLGLLWAILALVLCATIIGAPMGFVMFNQLPAVLTLQQH